MINITLTYEPHDLTLITRYEELGNVTVMRPIDTIPDYPNTEILVTTFLNPVDKKFLDWMKKLKVIAAPMTGLDTIDLEECEKRGITVLSLKGETEFLKTISSVAELCVWMMLELLRRPHESGRFMGNQLKEKELVIIGYGRIGQQLHKFANAFEMHTSWRDKEHVEPLSSFLNGNSLYAPPDIVSLNVPLNKETENMITEEHLKMMKRTAFL